MWRAVFGFCVAMNVAGCGNGDAASTGRAPGGPGGAAGSSGTGGGLSGSGGSAGAAASGGSAGNTPGGSGGTQAGNGGIGGSAGSTGGSGGSAGANPMTGSRIGVGTDVCALDAAGGLVCWEGVVQSRPGPYTWLSINGSSLCVLDLQGRHDCSGVDDYSAPDQFIAIRAMSTRACAQRQNKTIVCWGEDSNGNVSNVTTDPVDEFSAGAQTCAVKYGAPPQCWGPATYGAPPAIELRNLAATQNQTCGVDLQGKIRCWGRVDYEAVETGFVKAMMAWDGLNDWGCGMKQDGRLLCWGTAVIPSADRTALRFVDFALDIDGACGVLTDGSVRCWGDAGTPPGTLRVF